MEHGGNTRQHEFDAIQYAHCPYPGPEVATLHCDHCADDRHGCGDERRYNNSSHAKRQLGLPCEGHNVTFLWNRHGTDLL